MWKKNLNCTNNGPSDKKPSSIKSIPIKELIFYTLLFIYMVWGTLKFYSYFHNFIVSKNYLQDNLMAFVFPICFTFIFDGIFVCFLIRNFSNKTLVKYVGLFLVFSIFVYVSTKTLARHNIFLPDSINIFTKIFLTYSYAILNQVIYIFWIFVLLPFSKNFYLGIKHKVTTIILTILGILLSFIIIPLIPFIWSILLFYRHNFNS